MNDNFIPNYPDDYAYNVNELMELNTDLRALMGYLSLFDSDEVVAIMELRQNEVEEASNKSKKVMAMDEAYVTFGGDVYRGSLKSKVGENLTAILLDFSIMSEVGVGEEHYVSGYRFTLEMSIPFFVALIEDASFLRQKSNRFVGAVGHLISAIFQHKNVNCTSNVIDGAPGSENSVLLGLNLEKNLIDHYPFPTYLKSGFLCSLSSTPQLFFEPENVKDLTNLEEDISPEFRAIYDEIERKFNTGSVDSELLFQDPQLQHPHGNVFLEKPLDFGYMIDVVGSVIHALDKNIADSVVDENSARVVLSKKRLAELKNKLEQWSNERDVLNDDDQFDVNTILRMSLVLIPNYRFESRGFVRSDEPDIPLADEFTSLGTEQSGEDASPAKTARFRHAEELQSFKLQVPVSLREAINSVAKSRRISASAIANQMFEGDETTRKQVAEARARILGKALKVN